LSNPTVADQTQTPTPAPAQQRWLRRSLCALWILARLALILLVVTWASLIALSSGFRAHPDEDVHVDAFHYFEDHWSIPEPGLPGLQYSSMGWSRVYTGEIVYPLYGQAGRFVQEHWTSLRPLLNAAYRFLNHRLASALDQPIEATDLPEEINPDNLYLIYRFFNIALLLFTLLLIFFAFQRCRWINPAVLGFTFIAIPQVPYIYSYANSDAWGVTWSLLLFLQTATLIDRPPKLWRWYTIALWMFSFVMLLLAKADFVRLCFILPSLLLITNLIRHRRDLPRRFPLWLLTRWLAPIALCFFLAGLYDPSYTFDRSNWNNQLEDMKQERSQSSYKREGGWIPNVYMIDKGYTYWTLIHRGTDEGDWLMRSLQSFYCRFAAWQEHPEPWIFQYAANFALAGLALTLLAQLLFRKRASPYLYVSLLFSPILIALNLYGMLWYSLHIDFQPQGRYLFPSLAAVFLLFAGTTKSEWWPYRYLHLALVLCAMVLGLYCLHQYGILDETMRRGGTYSGS